MLNMPQVRTESPAYYTTDHNLEAENAVLDQALTILGRRLRTSEDPISSPDMMRDYLRLRIAHLDYEVFGAVWLDNRHRVLDIGEIFRGTIDGSSVFPREVVKDALRVGAAAVIVYHNHPSGEATPSSADMRITDRLKQALALFDIRLLDHFIVGSDQFTSMAERGLV